MNDVWIKDIMSQKFLNSDSSRIIMLKAMIKDGIIHGAYKKSDIMEYIYRVYSDYEDLRNVHPDARIRNIKRYGIPDVKYLLDDALKIWQEYAANNVLVYDERYIYIRDVEDSGVELAKLTKQICDMLARKYFSLDIREPLELKYQICEDDSDLEVFGTSLFRNRVFEDIQYCPLCEEIDTEKLRVVHILPARLCSSTDELIDKNNGLIFCQDHAKEYVQGCFRFEENGFVRNINSTTVNEKMHLAIQIKNRRRREYIVRYSNAVGRIE